MIAAQVTTGGGECRRDRILRIHMARGCV